MQSTVYNWCGPTAGASNLRQDLTVNVSFSIPEPSDFSIHKINEINSPGRPTQVFGSHYMSAMFFSCQKYFFRKMQRDGCS